MHRTARLRSGFILITVGAASVICDVQRDPMRVPNTKIPVRAFSDAWRELRQYFLRNGYVRRRSYQKSDEVRLTAQDEDELRRLQDLLTRAGFLPGRPFEKGRQYRLPIYGRAAVRRFLRLVRVEEDSEASERPNDEGCE
jgi:hypothetical protein